MEIALNKIMPNAITKQVMMKVGTKTRNERNWKDMTIKNVEMVFVSKKHNCVHGLCNYFNITDDTLLQSNRFKEFDDKVNYSPFWNPDGDKYLLRVNVNDTEKERLKGKYIADVKLERYSDYKVGWYKGICYRAKLINMREVKLDIKCDGLLEDD